MSNYPCLFLKNHTQIRFFGIPVSRSRHIIMPLKLMAQFKYFEFDQIKNENNVSKLFEGLEYCLSQAKLDENNNEKYLKEADILIRKIGGNISGINHGIRFINDAIELNNIKPHQHHH